jgi:hypothetical protein
VQVASTDAAETVTQQAGGNSIELIATAANGSEMQIISKYFLPV